MKECYKMIAIDLNKQQTIYADPKAIEQINFIRNIVQDTNANITIFFFIEKAKKTLIFRFFTRNFESNLSLFCK